MKKLYEQESTSRRMSQKGPNMQSIRKGSPEAQKIREAFVKDLDPRWVETDYSDIEKRIMEMYSESVKAD